jgi:hypothetical protein
MEDRPAAACDLNNRVTRFKHCAGVGDPDVKCIKLYERAADSDHVTTASFLGACFQRWRGADRMRQTLTYNRAAGIGPRWCNAQRARRPQSDTERTGYLSPMQSRETMPARG